MGVGSIGKGFNARLLNIQEGRREGERKGGGKLRERGRDKIIFRREVREGDKLEAIDQD